jgi:myo-inositol-1(or 4)-monophosphatase
MKDPIQHGVFLLAMMFSNLILKEFFMHNKIVQFSEDIARRAGDILLQGFRSDRTEISYKSRTDLVTNYDRKSEEFLVTEIHRAFPDHTVIAEEGNSREKKRDFIWYVDPLDGTNNFAHGIAGFCVSIGVFSREENSVAAGVVFDPFHDEMFSAVLKGGAFLNSKKISVSAIDNIGISVLATGFPYDKENNEKKQPEGVQQHTSQNSGDTQDGIRCP